MTIVTFNCGITTNEERTDLLEYERRALAEMDETLRVTGVKWDGDVYMPGLSGETPPAKSYIALDEGNKFMIDGRFTRTQPVNLTPGALGVRCEE